MATANLEECENICVELLNCTQCETRYDQSSHQPRILPCLHTICTDCLMKSFESNSIECTVCQKSVNIQDSFESLKDDFPIDFTIRDRIEFVDTLNQNKSSICDFCDESKTATYRCKDCENFICEICIKFHNKSNKFKNHITRNLSERSDISEFSHEVFCTKDGHENRPLEIFCTGNGCKRPVCNMCFAIDHSDSGDHQAKDVQDVFKLEMERIFDKYKETEELRHGISEVRKRIKDEMSVIQRQKETEQDKINEFFIHCHKLLESRQNMLTQKLDTETEIKRNALALQEEELDSFQNKILTSKVFLQQTSLSKNAPAFLVSVSSVDKQLDEIKKTEFDRQPAQIANMKFIDDREQSENIIKHLGILLASTAVPYKSEIENPKTMYAKTDGIFEVRLKDSQGRPVKDQSIYMEIILLDKKGGQEFTLPFYVSGANGCFKAKCTINSPGTYQANVLINGTTFFKLDTISCLEHELEENSSDFVFEKHVEKKISAQVRIRGCEGLQKDETDTSKDSSNVKPNNDKKKKSTPLKKKFQIEEKKTTVTEGLPGKVDAVFETFYHRSGREFQCMYLNGMRYYLDDWGSKEWQTFPKRWYQEGLLITNTVVKNGEIEAKSKATRPTKDGDDREGSIMHPRKKKIPTYIFQRKHNIHCFYDHDNGQWMRMPIGYELQHKMVVKLVDQVEEALPDWSDRNDILAMLRQCNYDADECINTYLHLEGDEWLKYSRTSKK